MWLPLLLLAAAPAEGRPLFYWGARPPVIEVESPGAGGDSARVEEVHAAFDKGALVVRFTFDRRVAQSLRLADGTPVSGRLKAVLYFDADDDRRSGLAQGESDQRTGCERRLEIGVVAMGADEEEKRAASAVVAATLYALSPEGRRRTLWRADDEQAPGDVSAHGEWLEIRVPVEPLGLGPTTRLVLAAGDALSAGRLTQAPPPAAAPAKNDAPAQPATRDTDVVLRPGEAHRAAGGLSIVFKEVLADSRCPKGETCVWAGDASVRLVVAARKGSRSVDVALSAKTATPLEGDRSVRLLGLEPAPAAGRVVAPADYRASLRLVRGADEAPGVN